MKGTISAKNAKKYSNQWVAFINEKSKVLAYGKNIAEVEKKLKENRQKADEISFIMPANHYYAP